VGSSEEISITGLAELVRGTLDSSSVIEYVPYERAYAPGFDDMLRRKPVLEKLKRHIEYLPTTPLRRMIELTAAR